VTNIVSKGDRSANKWRKLQICKFVDLITIYAPYDLYGPVRNVFDAGRYITWASEKGSGPGNGEFFGPCEMASSR
jgi:hypothetical protein